MRAADFLFPRDLEVTSNTISRILIVGSCNAGTYKQCISRNSPGVVVDHIVLNNVQILPDLPSAEVNSYNFQVITLSLREVVTDRVIEFTKFEENHDNILNYATNILELQIEQRMKYNREHGLLTLVTNFNTPQTPVASSLFDGNSPRDLKYVVQELNRRLADLVRKYDNAYLADIESITASVGKMYFQDDSMNFYSHGSYWHSRWTDYDLLPTFNAPQPGRIDPLPPLSDLYECRYDEFLEAVWRQWVAIYRIAHQIDKVKMVIFDLDDTLWRGQIAEHYGDNQKWPAVHGWPTGIPETIHHLRARGILVAIASKNEMAIVTERWKRAVYQNWVQLADFPFKEINWQPKSENIASMIAAASLTPKSVVFVDDNPVERESVRAALDGIRVIGSNPYMTRRVLLWSPETQAAKLTDEARRRETMIRQQQYREAVRASLPREEFLADLQCEVNIQHLNNAKHPSFERAFELLNKTNQFNTTGKRWSIPEILEFFQEGGKFFFFNAQDKFTSYGLVGVILYQSGRFVQFAMSCRVIGLEIETTVINMIMAAEHRDQPEVEFCADAIDTELNIVSRTLFDRCGFTKDATDPHRYLRTDPCIAPPAPHLQVTFV